MKEVEKKDTPEISGGALPPLVTDPPLVGPDYPQTPTTPETEGERDLPTWQN